MIQPKKTFDAQCEVKVQGRDLCHHGWREIPVVRAEVLSTSKGLGRHLGLEEDLHGGRWGDHWQEEVLQAGGKHHQDQVWPIILFQVNNFNCYIYLVVRDNLFYCSQRLSLGMTSHMKGRLLAKAELPGEVGNGDSHWTKNWNKCVIGEVEINIELKMEINRRGES